jgi:serine-type D-Ala-D-Ala carboxypeptidase/endopeptidase (penicillin-binding protein 4)
MISFLPRLLLICALFVASASRTCQARETAPAPGALPAVVTMALKRAQVNSKDVSFYAQAVDGSPALVAVNESSSLILASTTKLVTALAALDLLGPSFRWRTSAFLSGALKDGRLDGDLTLVGGGDPMLTEEHLKQWFGRMRKHGLTAINGNIVIDRLLFRLKPADFANLPKPSWENGHHVHPDAFVINEGVIEVVIKSDALGLPIVATTPVIEHIKIAANVQPVARCSERKRPLSVSWDEAHTTIVVDGNWAPDCEPQRAELLAFDSAQMSKAVVSAAWASVGGTLAGTVIERVVPAEAVRLHAVQRKRQVGHTVASRPANRGERSAARRLFLSHDSVPLTEVIRAMNKWSNNLIARNVFLSLAVDFPRRPVTLTMAQEAMRNWLVARGLQPDAMQLDNGSGLSRQERGQALALARLLIEGWNSRVAKPFIDSLAVAGTDGTLTGRMSSSAVTGNAFMKTGSLSEVRALAGYVRAASGKTYAVVSNINEPDAARSLPALDAFVHWVFSNG